MGYKVAMLALADPTAGLHGGMIRTRALHDALERLGHQTNYYFPERPIGEQVRQASLHDGEPNQPIGARLIGRLGVLKREYLPMPTAAGVRDPGLVRRLASSSPDVTIISALSLRQFLSPTRGAIWTDFMDVWSDFARREANHRHGLAKLSSLGQARLLARDELALASRSAIVTAAGWNDSQHLRARGVEATWLPVWLKEEPREPQPRARDTRRTAGFIGNFDYWPNRAAIDLLTTRWLPRMREAGWEVVVAGRHSERIVPAPGLRCIGEVEHLDEFYEQISLSLAPIKLGGGIKVKVIESLMRGVPVLGTPEAAEGLSPESARYIALCGDDGPSAEQLTQASGRVPDPEHLVPYTEGFALTKLGRIMDSIEIA